MRKWSLGEQAMEEFMVGIKQKECIFLTLQGEGMLFEDLTESTKGTLTLMLNELNITYNRVRQADITQELTEIIGGANAQKRK